MNGWTQFINPASFAISIRHSGKVFVNQMNLSYCRVVLFMLVANQGGLVVKPQRSFFLYRLQHLYYH